MEADLKTFTAMGVYGMTALTVIVAQNPKDWAHEMYPIGMDVIEKQIKTIVEPACWAARSWCSLLPTRLTNII